eukprot:gene3717-6605_t
MEIEEQTNSLEYINEEEEEQTDLDFLINQNKNEVIVGQGTFEIPRENKIENFEENSFKARIKQIRSSRLFAVYYIIVILLCISLLVWTVFEQFHPRNFVFVFFEGLLTILLIIDVSMDVIISNWLFFSSWMNIIDLVVCFLSTLSFLLYLITPHLSVGEEFEILADLSLIIFFNLTQIARLTLFILQ